MSHKRVPIRILHQNINRLANKTYRIESELELRDPADVLCLTEHWLQPNQITSVSILNYHLRAHYCRPSRAGGGACIYVRSGVPCIERKEIADLSVESQFEVCAVECIGKDLIIVCVYRPPSGDIPLYLSMLMHLFNLSIVQNYNVIIIGDINIDLMTKCNNSTYLLNTLKQYGFRQLVNVPTRLTKFSKTCIDHIYTNINKTNVKTVSCDDMHLSDHLCIGT
jgi:exonuclease III